MMREEDSLDSLISFRASISRSDSFSYNEPDFPDIEPLLVPVTPQAEPAPVPPKPSTEISDNDRANYLSRCFENGRFFGAPERLLLDLYYQGDQPHSWDPAVEDADIAIGLAVGSAAGLLSGWILHLICKRHYTKKKGVLNPAYRAFKTCAAAGAVAGLFIAALLPFPDATRKFFSSVISDVVSIVMGLFAIPYWYIREKILDIDPATNTTYFKVGTEGWTKTCKSLLVWGSYLGTVCGAIACYSMHIPLSLGVLAIYSSAVAIGMFALAGIVALPLYNYFTGNSLTLSEMNKDIFRNNYVRTGIVLGLALGTLASIFIPGASLAFLTFTAAIGGVVGGVMTGILGNKITQRIKNTWDKENSDPKNSWDYGSRATALLFTSLGMAIGFFLPIPFGSVIGAAAGSLLGWAIAFPVYKISRTIRPKEVEATTLPWSQRCSAGTSNGMLIGAAIGLAIVAALGGPFTLAGVAFGMVGAAGFFGSIGAVVGGIGAILYGKETRTLIKAAILGRKAEDPPVANNTAKTETEKSDERRPSFNRSLTPFVVNPKDLASIPNASVPNTSAQPSQNTHTQKRPPESPDDYKNTYKSFLFPLPPKKENSPESTTCKQNVRRTPSVGFGQNNE